MNDARVTPLVAGPAVVLWRGGEVESRHRVHVVVVDRHGAVLRGAGDLEYPTFLRSAAKPFQALALAREGVVEAFAIPPDELALCCASHSGEPEHVQGVRRILARCGIPESALECGPHPPMSEAAAAQLARAGTEPERIHNNCSGKHAGMLALARHRGWPLEGYHRDGHPVQIRMAEEIARATGVPTERLTRGTDGCGVVTFAVPLRAMARAFAGLAAEAADDPHSARVLNAMSDHPFRVAGTGRLCTRIIRESGGRVVAKVGAEGVYAAVHRDRCEAIALKVEDGAGRAAEVALARALDRSRWLDEPAAAALADRRPWRLTNTRGDVASVLEATFELEGAP